MDTIENYYDRYDENKNYERVLIREGYGTQGSEINEIQSIAMARLQGVADALFADGDIIRDAAVSINPETGEVQAQSGAVYIKGAVRGVAPAVFTIPTTGTVAIGIRLSEKVISELEDASLYNPAKGSRGEGLPGAWRLQITARWGFDGDNGSGEFFPVYSVDDGELRAKEAPPSLDALSQSIARYDRDSTGGGSYVVEGLTVRRAEDKADGSQVYTVAEGRCRVNGYGVDMPTSRRLNYAALPDLRFVDTEVHTADATSAAEGGQRITVAHPPLKNVTSIRITAQKTVSLTHGSYAGAADSLPDTSVVAILQVRQGDTVFEAETDYKKTGDTVNWSPAGNEPAPGSTYEATYTYITACEPLASDVDGFNVAGAVEGSSILVSYNQMLPRLDRLCLDQEGRFVWLKGVAAELNARAPATPEALLSLALVNQTWRPDGREACVLNDAVRVVPFSEIEAINQRIDYVLREVSRNRLETDMATRESGARVGIFVDPLLDDSMRDEGIEQSAAVVDGELTLPIDARVHGLSADLSVPASAAYTPFVIMEQPFRTGAMKVNPYQAFEPLPARATLNPAVDHWTEVQENVVSTVTRYFQAGHFVWGRSWQTGQSTSTSKEVLSSGTTALAHLRRIDVQFRLEGFGPHENLEEVTFDGIVVPATA